MTAFCNILLCLVAITTLAITVVLFSPGQEMHKISKAYADVLRRIKNGESEQYQLTKLLSFLYCSVNPNKEKTPNLPTGGWCAPETGEYYFDDVLAKSLVEKVFTGQRVGEFGGGKGHYSKYFQKTKKLKSVRCYDGAGNIEQVTKGFVTHLDLSKEQHELPMFDWVFSTEVLLCNCLFLI